MEAARDPKEIITPDAFSVAPELLGTPLAHPWRRAAAMAIDLIAVAVFGQFGWIFAGVAASLLLLRRAFGRREDRAVVRALAGGAGVLLLAGTLAGTWVSCSDGDGGGLRREVVEAVVGRQLSEVSGFVGEAMTIIRAETEGEVRGAAQSFARRMERQGMGPDEIRSALEELAAQRPEPWARAAILEAVPAVEERPPDAAVDSLLLSYAEAVRSGDTVRAAELRDPLTEAVAADRTGELERRIVRLRRQNDQLESRVEEMEERGLLNLLLQAADEVGLGFGWAGLYFTLFVVVWSGRTPGKRLLGIRIVRLDGERIGWWVAFNRFGGYAASIFTGLLGFAEMLWDANRQALHDRIAATVVVREGARTQERNKGSSPHRTEGGDSLDSDRDSDGSLDTVDRRPK